jgi:molybdate transport system substrate-binding protein
VRGKRTVLMLVSIVVVLSACSSGNGATSGGSSRTGGSTMQLTVLGAASLSTVFPGIGNAFTASNPGVSVRFGFAGTDALVAQVEQGAPADVFAGASTKYGDQLSGENLIGAPVPFATNSLVVIVPAANPAHISSPQDLSRSGIKVVIGAGTVPIGAYTRTVLTSLDGVYGNGYSDAVLANVASEEDSVTTILSKVQLGEADAGFVYETDARAAGAQVTSVELPAEAQAVATYPIATVDASKHGAEAQTFVDFVLEPRAQAMLAAAGFGPPPSG